MSFKCKQIIEHIEKLCPKELAFDWDNVGLIVGDSEQDVNKVLVALDPIEEVIQEAINKKVDMIITHHPLFIPNSNSPIKSVTTKDRTGKLICELIKNNISLYCAHTNLDIAEGGINDELVKLLNLTNVKPLEVVLHSKLKKLVVFVPDGHTDKVRDAISEAGAGWIGNYSDCTFMLSGTGTFRPLEGTNPYIGSTNELEKVNEYRIETIIEQNKQSDIIKAMVNAHPYEEVAYDVYPVENKGKAFSIGRIGEFENSVDLSDFIETVKNKLDVKTISLVGDTKSQIKKVAVCSGSGMGMLSSAVNGGADVFLTGDVKFHDAQKAIQHGINVIDAGHYYTENIIVPVLKEYVEKLDKLEVIESKIDGNPFKFL